MADLLAKIVGGTMLIATVVPFVQNPLPILFLAALLPDNGYWINPRI